MRKLVKGLLLAVVIGGLCDSACGDGKFFVTEKVPAGVPYQRAFIFFHDDSETLVLQSQYKLPRSTAIGDLGWVVPAPAVPELASVDSAAAKQFFRDLSFRTQPEPHHISSYLLAPAVVVFLGALALLLVCLMEYPFLSRTKLSRTAWHKRARASALVAIFTFVFVVALVPPLQRGTAGVEVLKAEKVGIYDVKVIRGETAGTITNWLDENGFGYDANDSAVFENYVDRNWCFVTAKVATDPNTAEGQIVAEGLVAPLILKFPSEEPVYPLALTSVAGTKTEVLLYTLSDRKLTCGGRLPLRHARETDPQVTLRVLRMMAEIEGWTLFDDVPDESMMLCKFKGRLTPDQMKQDLILKPAPDNEPYRETKTVW
jgi:hypothetical protein